MGIQVVHAAFKNIADEKFWIMEQLTGIDVTGGRETEFAVAQCAFAVAALLSPVERRFAIGERVHPCGIP